MSLRFFRLLLLTLVVFSAGCASLEPLLDALTPVPTPTRPPTSAPPATATATAPAPAQPPLLRIWLPPQFHPAADNDASMLLAERLAEFESQHPGLQLEIRARDTIGEDDIVEFLSLANAAAPAVLPDLVLLSRPQLESAALRGLLHPFDGLSTELEDPNWYAYARQLARIQNTEYGLPFAGDALVLVYYPELGTVVSWEDILSSDGQLVFAAGNLDGLVGLSLYASAGGDLVNADGLPTLEAPALTRTLAMAENAASEDVFSASLANITTEAQTLQIYRSGSANKAIIWILNYRAAEDGAVAPLPGLGEAPFSYASGWMWALAGSNPEKQQLAVELAEYLVEEPFIGEWTLATGHLPTRPSSIEESDRTMSAILESAQPIPARDVLAVLGPLMQEALTRVLNGEPPDVVVESVIAKLQP